MVNAIEPCAPEVRLTRISPNGVGSVPFTQESPARSGRIVTFRNPCTAGRIPFEAAGKCLGVGKSAVRNRVRGTDRELGTTVFCTRGKGIVPTDAGNIYLSVARESLRQASLGVERVRAFVRVKANDLRIGYSSQLNVRFSGHQRAICGKEQPWKRRGLCPAGKRPSRFPLSHRCDSELAYLRNVQKLAAGHKATGAGSYDRQLHTNSGTVPRVLSGISPKSKMTVPLTLVFRAPVPSSSRFHPSFSSASDRQSYRNCLLQ